MVTTNARDSVAGSKRRRILIVDDHPVVQEGFARIINESSDLEACCFAKDSHGALRAIAEKQPDLVLLDISLEGPDGLEVLKLIRAREPKLPVLILSMHDERNYAERALRAGANGYVMKQEAVDRILGAIRRVLAGEIYVSEGMASRILRQVASPGGAEERPSPIARLSDRELEIFRLIGQGQGSRQIADKLRISIKTVETHEAHLKEKLGVKSIRDLMRYAVEWTLTNRD